MSPPAVLEPVATMEQLAGQWYDEVERAALRMSTARSVPREVAAFVDGLAQRLGAEPLPVLFAATDPYLAQMVLAATLTCQHAARRRTAEAAPQLRVGLERLRQALRDVLEERAASADQPPKELARWLSAQLSVPQPELAALLGVSARTVQRWISETDPAAPHGEELTRLQAVARVTNHLRHVFTGPGVLRWFEREHPHLRAGRPRDLLADPLRLPELTSLATRSRSTLAG